MMLKLTELDSDNETANTDEVVTLPFEYRQKSRLLSRTDQGTQIGIFLPRGQTLRHGLVLTGQDKIRVRISAAPEALSVVSTDDSLLFARACYHLGNRHIPLQILPGELRFITDHVLDQMLMGLGLTIRHALLPFEPEHGAYHTHGH